jgi:hypothetical protein
MLSKWKLTIALAMLGLTTYFSSHAAEHPSLVMTKAGVEQIRAELGSVPLFDATLMSVKREVDSEIALGIETPIPKDFSGGYTHERHKQNFFTLQKAGLLFQILQDDKYAVYIRDMLFQYEAMYKELPLHPQQRSYSRGKLFWQCLNDSNWLVYVSQAYDSIYEWLSEEERKSLEDNLFRPFADFISLENPQFFNRVHNHSTWGTAAVGMIGLVMGDDELVDRALYGIKGNVLDAEAKDNDGGFIKVEGQRPGFLSNLEEPFSPDGYYTEGPYYQRYAMYPFLVFSLALHNSKPELEIFEHKDGVLLKAVVTLLQLSDADGDFFPLNDAQKGMSYHARELITAVDIAYHVGGRDPQLLSIAEEQGQVLLDDAGFSVAAAIRDGNARPFEKSSVNLSDGSDGTQGGVAILRSADIELVFKYAAQGLSHGHYDKLSFSLYRDGDEVLQDYGLARFVNIEQKGGGNYLKENSTWAKQTIAHNTITINETSHFQGNYDIGSRHHSELHFFHANDPDRQVVSATEVNAYPGTEMRRTMALIRDDSFENPILLDIFKLTSSEPGQYDLPFYFLGQLIDANFEYEVPEVLRELGKANGYQHLYLEGKGQSSSGNARVSWLDQGRFNTLTVATDLTDELLFTRLGANDPEFNLRRDAAFMLRRSNSRNTVFASTVETHGSYNPVTELSVNSNSNIAALKIAFDDASYTAVSIEEQSGRRRMFIVAADASTSQRHQLKIAGQVYRWSGPYYYTDVE